MVHIVISIVVAFWFGRMFWLGRDHCGLDNGYNVMIEELLSNGIYGDRL